MKKLLTIVICIGMIFISALPSYAAEYVSTNEVNFFLQLEGCQMDTDGNIAPRPKSVFTESVKSGELADGNRASDYTVVLGGGVTVDDVIAEVIDKPTDDEVFDSAKSQLMKSGYIRSSNGKVIPWSEFTSENYRAEWYVLKYEVDGWHVDGRIIDKATDDVIEIIIPDNPDDIPDEAHEEPDVPLPSGEEIDLSGIRYAYIFGYEPIINIETTIDENGYTITSVNAEIYMAPDDAVTREQTAVMITRLIDQKNNAAGKDYPLTDNIKHHKGTWYERVLSYLASQGAFDDIDSVETGFITRGEVAKLVCFGLNLPEGAETSFTDIAGSEFKPYIEIMNHYGYMNGVYDTIFEPDRVMTRAEFCTMFNHIIGRDDMGLVVADGREVTCGLYSIVDLAGHWAEETMLKATSAYDKDGYVDVDTRLANIRNILDQYDAQKMY